MNRSRVVLVGVIVSLLGLAACITPAPTGTPIPSYYLQCVTSPVCPVISPSYNALSPAALSDSGDVMVSINRPYSGTTGLPQSVELVSIHDRWFRRVLTGTKVEAVAMSADGQKLAILAYGVQPTSTDPGGDGLFLFDHATGLVTRPDQPPGLYSTGNDYCCHVSMSADGAVVSANAGEAAAVFDTNANTYQDLTQPGLDNYFFDVSGDGTTVVMSIATFDGDDSAVYLYDVASSTTTTIGQGRGATVSGDGSRVLFLAQPLLTFGSPIETMIWDSTTDTSRVLSSAEIDNLQLSTDGTRFFGTLVGEDEVGTVIDGRLSIDGSGNASASYPAIAGPALGETFTTASRNGDHVIYRDILLLGYLRWNRN